MRDLRRRFSVAVVFVAAVLELVPLGAQVAPFRRGDANIDGVVDLTDGVYTLNVLFQDAAEAPCRDALDANDSGELDLTDAVFLLNFLFLGGPVPRAPGPFECGRDPSADDLSCEAYTPTSTELQCSAPDVGSLFSVRFVPLEEGAGSLVLKDVDTDGDVDMIVGLEQFFDPALPLDFTFLVLLGDGAGGFAPPRSYRGPHSAVTSLEVVDLDGDGRLDVVGANVLSPGTLPTLWGNGDGTFLSENPIEVGQVSERLAAGDLDADGDPDLVVLSSTPGTRNSTILTVTNEGGRAFAVGVPEHSTGFFPNVALGDVDRDGDIDAVLSRSGADSLEGGISLLRNSGDGTFAEVETTDLRRRVPHLELADMDADGVLDGVAQVDGANVAILRGLGNGSFTAGPEHRAWTVVGRLQVADMDADGALDVVTRQGEVFFGKGDGTLGETPTEPIMGSSAFAVGDIDNDGAVDFVGGTDFGDRSVLALAFGRGDGRFRGIAGTTERQPADFFALGDLNGDAVTDVVSGRLKRTLWVFDGRGDGTFSVPQVHPVPNLRTLALGDLDGDRRLDAVAAGSGITVFLNGGDGALFEEPRLEGEGEVFESIVLSDFDADGVLDILGATSEGLEPFLGIGDGAFIRSEFIPLGTLVEPVVRTGDFDTNGTADVVLTHRGAGANGFQDGQAIVFLNLGDGTLSEVARHDIRSSPNTVAVGDVSGDGTDDLVVAHWVTDVPESNVSVNAMTVFLGGGDGSFEKLATFRTAFTSFGCSGNCGHPQALALGDFNGDSILDVASGTREGLTLLLGRGDGGFEPPFLYGTLAGGALAAQDFDADGRTDLATINWGVTLYLNSPD